MHQAEGADLLYPDLPAVFTHRSNAERQIRTGLYQWHEHNGTFTSLGFKQRDAAAGAGQNLPAKLFDPKSERAPWINVFWHVQ